MTTTPTHRPRSRAWLGLCLAVALVLSLACGRSAGQPPGVPGPSGPTFAQPPMGPPAPEAPAVRPSKDGTTYDRLTRFASAAEFDAWLKKTREAWERQQRDHARRASGGAALGLGGPQPTAAAPTAEPTTTKAGAEKDAVVDSITNNQEAGVDEGDIVKAAGDFFVVLRRGRLFSVRQGEAGRPTLTAVGRCNAYPKGGSRGTWYDEMLIHGSRIVVIGFSYRVGGTEVGLFTLHRNGRITHDATHFIRSNDYYSSRNYASRLVGSTLVFYMPWMLPVYNRGEAALPSVASWQQAKRHASPWKEILAKVDIYRPVQPTPMPTLHTVVQCDLAQPDFTCRARALVGPFSRTFYVSQDAVYLWVTQGWWGWGQRPTAEERNVAWIYRLPLMQDGVTAMRARGNPIDQFSFKQGTDGQLNVLVTEQGGGDFMWAPERARGRMALLRVPIAAFAAQAQDAPVWAYTSLPYPTQGYALQNRFVGDWVLWGAGAGWWRRTDPQQGGTIYVTNVTRPWEARQLSLDHGVDRIEAMGRNAVLVGGAGNDLYFTAVELPSAQTIAATAAAGWPAGAAPMLGGTYVRRNAAQGETRSHGFFFQPDRTGDGAGMLGLPIRVDSRPGHHLVYGSAEIAFLRVDAKLHFAPVGALAAHAAEIGRVNDACVVSCVDWYGNARPIFYQGRVFALLGYEIVEGAFDAQGTMHEKARIDYLTPTRIALAR